MRSASALGNKIISASSLLTINRIGTGVKPLSGSFQFGNSIATFQAEDRPTCKPASRLLTRRSRS